MNQFKGVPIRRETSKLSLLKNFSKSFTIVYLCIYNRSLLSLELLF